MKNNSLVVIVIIALILIAGGFYYFHKPETSSNGTIPVATADDIRGCYVATLGKDVYSLNIASQEGENVSGTLVFKNYQKDSSHGTFEGTYKDGILKGYYSFNSEGMDSVMEVIFRKSDNDFMRGYGPVDAESGIRFTDLSKITYDPNQTFRASSGCATTL